MSEVKEIEAPPPPIKGLPWRDYKNGTVVKIVGEYGTMRIDTPYRIVTDHGLVNLHSGVHSGDVYTSGGLYEKVYGVTIVNA